MWALRAAVRPGLWLPRLSRGCPAPRVTPPLPCPARALASFGRRGPGSSEGPASGGRGPRAHGRVRQAGEDEEEPGDSDEEEEDEEEEEEEDLLLPTGTQRVCLVHPEVKWGPGKPQMTKAWSVHGVHVHAVHQRGLSTEPTSLRNDRRAFPDVCAVFMPWQQSHLAPLLVWPRQYTRPLTFVRLLPALRVPELRVAPSPAGTWSQDGCPCCTLHDGGHTRVSQQRPTCVLGKTTLIKALTGDAAIQPRDQLFATLDITAHAGSLPSRMTVLYMDTIGFLSELPHGLIESFSATLEDVAHSDLIVHVRDVSHPETERQKASVLSALRGLRLPGPLLDTMVEVHNKVDLVPGYSPAEPGAVAVSALLGRGLQQLKAELEEAVLRATGRQVLTLRVRLAGAQLSWLHREATVQQVDVIPEDGVADVKVIISNAAYGKFRKLFPG
uniref:GTP binding protein 6 (putative) n=1 Tax=Propithecus coquereli TaxID=379532 RepID=A0A2K6EWC0_PROCO